jgi:Rieske Fe-S protein
MEKNVTRRAVLAAAPGMAGLGVLAACGGNQSGTEPAASASPKGGRVLAEVADIPVGGAVSASDPSGKPLIVSRPSAGKVVAFSAVCSHMGCTVAPEGKILKCPCHGSTYDPATGKNTGGPAPRPLTPVAVVVREGEVVES